MLPSLAPEASASAIPPRPHDEIVTQGKLICQEWCRGPESNRYGCLQPTDFKSVASASSATPAAISIGAGDGNRTHVISLEGWSSTIELHPHNNKWSWREELNPQPADYKSAALPIELHQPEKMVPSSGIEPLTRGFSVPCSTN